MLKRLELWYDKVGSKILYVIILILSVYVFIKYIFPVTAPFVIAWILATLLNPVVTFLYQRIRLSRGVGTILSMLTVLTSLFMLIISLVKQLWYQAVDFTFHFPYYRRQITRVIEMLEEKLQSVEDIIPISDIDFSLDSILDSALGTIGSFLETLAKQVGQTVAQVPNALVFVIVMLLATFFMTKDYQKIKEFVKAQVPSKMVDKFGTMQSGLINALGGYVKTQLIMLCFTFCICFVGFLVLGHKYILLLSFGIALFDALPIFGSGAILLPMAIYNVIMGNYSMAIGIFAIYALIFLTRQIVEPRILSGQIGIYALVTIMAMYIGLKLFGVIGLIIGPVTAVTVKTLQTAGVIPNFKQPAVAIMQDGQKLPEKRVQKARRTIRTIKKRDNKK
jgi:sporulation integral membrane protein YtvI